MRRLGIDLGSHRTGLSAHHDPEVPARWLPEVSTTERPRLLDEIAALCARESIEEVVVGLPLHMNGSEGSSARGARSFAGALAKRTGLPVVLWDERLTTVQAQRARIARGLKGAKGRAAIDSEAAAILLQSYVDAQSHGASGRERDP